MALITRMFNAMMLGLMALVGDIGVKYLNVDGTEGSNVNSFGLNL